MESDVVIVGYGPVGQLLAILLAQRGWSVTVVERWPQPFPMPRAVAYDGEAARILAGAGVAGLLDDVREPTRDYTWRNAAGETLLHMDVPEHSRSGWPESTSMYQPGLEAALTARGARFPDVRVLREREAVGLTDHGDHVELVTEDSSGGRETITAHWVVGCDGANSFVRGWLGTAFADFGFSRDWLICDVALHEEREFKPNNLQICDPARPRTAVSAGPGHRRWEFMRVDGETLEELNKTETVWRLLGLFDLTPETATLERYAVYTTQARCANQWRSGRVLIAGDAAHVMPPFVGQGMCSGFRDAANLAWKLDLVSSRLADASLLDSYTVERRAHVRPAIETSITLGKVLCETDPAAAAGRDSYLIGAQRRGQETSRQQGLAESLTAGFLRCDSKNVRLPLAGDLSPQGRVARGEEAGLLDDVVGTGFVLMATEDPRAVLEPGTFEFLERIGAQAVHLLPAGTPAADAGPHSVVDLDNVYLPYLKEARAIGVLVRPDFYVFGSARDHDDLTTLVEDFRGRLPALSPARS